VVKIVLRIATSSLRNRLNSILDRPGWTVVPCDAAGRRTPRTGGASPELLVVEAAVLTAGRLRASPAGTGTRVLAILDGPDDPTLATTLLTGRVDGLVDRDDPDRDFVEAARAVLAGSGWVSPQLAPRMLATLRDGIDSAAGLTASATALTAREQDVARLMSSGLTNSEIARELQVAVSTVKFHVSNVLRKMGCRDRAQLIAALHRGALPAGGPR